MNFWAVKHPTDLVRCHGCHISSSYPVDCDVYNNVRGRGLTEGCQGLFAPDVFCRTVVSVSRHGRNCCHLYGTRTKKTFSEIDGIRIASMKSIPPGSVAK